MSTHAPQATDPANMREAARLLYETTPLTLAEVAREVGLSERTLKRYSGSDGGWKKQAGPGISKRAHEAADKIATVTASLAPDAPPDQVQAVLAEAREEVAVDERAELIAKHRQQWRLVDGLVAEAVRGRDLQAAKLAETVCRTIAGKQLGERKAWGLDNSDTPAGAPTTVVIERC